MVLGAQVVPVSTGCRTLKDATSEAIRDWVANVEETHYIIGSTVGPHPYPTMVSHFQSVIGKEARQQILKAEGRLPSALIACVGVLWRYRRTWGRPVLFGVGYFVATLFPILGFFDFSFMQYSLVADHFQYVPIIGVIALMGGALAWVCRTSRGAARPWTPMLLSQRTTAVSPRSPIECACSGGRPLCM